jgi:hypothetical protein
MRLKGTGKPKRMVSRIQGMINCTNLIGLCKSVFGLGMVDSAINAASKMLGKAAEDIPVNRGKATVKIDFDLIHDTP